MDLLYFSLLCFHSISYFGQNLIWHWPFALFWKPVVFLKNLNIFIVFTNCVSSNWLWIHLFVSIWNVKTFLKFQLNISNNIEGQHLSKCGVFSGLHFPVFWLNTEIYYLTLFRQCNSQSLLFTPSVTIKKICLTRQQSSFADILRKNCF